MKIVIDDKIPYIQGAFEGVAEVLYCPGSNTTNEVVKDADALVTRTRTICNEELLRDTSVRFIATATIGYDHIDTEYCNRNDISWTNAPGCNSSSVLQYIASALMVLAQRKNFLLKELTIGVVGVGNVGRKVADFCRLLGMRVLLNDPPRQRVEGDSQFVSLERVQREADIITLHVPLNHTGEDATYHRIDHGFFSQLQNKVMLINTCRGEVVDTESVKWAIQEGKIESFVCDCWENEPFIDLGLLASTEIATPHIAGYSKDGKAIGTKMSVQAISRYFGLGLDDWEPQNIESPNSLTIALDGENKTEQAIIAKAILATYDIREDDLRLRANVADFEKQRGDYPVRREFQAYTITPKNISENTIAILKALGFRVAEYKQIEV